MKRIFCFVTIPLFFSQPLWAAEIIWVSFHASDAASANAAAAGLVDAPDKPYTDLLSANGHTVTRFLSKNDPDSADLATMNSADLIIIGRSVPSNNYQEATETAFWNTQVTTPVISMGSYPLRSSRLTWYTGTTIPDTVGTLTLLAVDPSHPVFNGISLDGSNNMVSGFAEIVTEPLLPTPLQRGVSVVTDPLAGGTVIASSTESATAGGAIIAEWSTGAVVNNGQVLSGPRMVFLSGSRENGASSETAGLYDLTADGATMFLNAVSYLAIPEPSAGLLLAFGLMVLSLFRKRLAG